MAAGSFGRRQGCKLAGCGASDGAAEQLALLTAADLPQASAAMEVRAMVDGDGAGGKGDADGPGGKGDADDGDDGRVGAVAGEA